MMGEDTALANLVSDPVSGVAANEESPQPVRRHVVLNTLRENTPPGAIDGVIANVCPEDLKWNLFSRGLDQFREGDGKRINFFACRTARNPDTEWFRRPAAYQNLRQFGPERFERGGFAKKRR